MPMPMPIQRASSHFPAVVASGDAVESQGCQACPEDGPTTRHAALGLILCADCCAAADSLEDLTRGPAIQTGFCS